MRVRSSGKIFVFDSNSKLLLLKRSDEDERRPGEWEIPGGHTEPGEMIEQAALRETYEEAGISLRQDDVMPVYTISEKVKDDLCVTWLFCIAQVASDDIILSNEHSQHRWVTINEAPKLITYDRQLKALEFIQRNNLMSAAYDR